MQKIIFFLLAGSLGFIADIGVFNLLHCIFNIRLSAARAISVLTAVIVTLCINKFITFSDQRNNQNSFEEVSIYIMCTAFSAVINFFVYLLFYLSNGQSLIVNNIGLIMGVCAGAVSNYFLYKNFVFANNLQFGRKSFISLIYMLKKSFSFNKSLSK